LTDDRIRHGGDKSYGKDAHRKIGGPRYLLLHRFGDAAELRNQREDEEWRQFLRGQDLACDPPGEPEYQELLRLLIVK
jgi:hypothetical protein